MHSRFGMKIHKCRKSSGTPWTKTESINRKFKTIYNFIFVKHEKLWNNENTHFMRFRVFANFADFNRETRFLVFMAWYPNSHFHACFRTFRAFRTFLRFQSWDKISSIYGLIVMWVADEYYSAFDTIFFQINSKAVTIQIQWKS